MSVQQNPPPANNNASFNHDNIAEVDLLGREKFALEIAKRLVHNFPNGSDGMVMAITGKWGSGKSTLLHYLDKHILAEHHQQKQEVRMDAVVIKFNPWMYNGQKELQAIFLKEIAIKSGNQNQAIKEFLGKLADRLIIPKLLGSLSYNVAGVGVTAQGFDKLFEDDLEQLKDNVNIDLITRKRKLYIIVDDLDRLEPQSIIEILQLIRLNASFKNVTYILAYDKDYVHQALKQKYGNNGDEYLEKIVQLDYAIPEPSSLRMEELFVNELHKLQADLGLDVSMKVIHNLWNLSELNTFFSTPRNIYRYFNSLRMRMPIIHQDIIVEDFMIVEVFRMFTHKVYKELIAYLSFSSYDERKRDFAKKYIDKEYKNVSVGKLIKVLDDSNYYRKEF